MLSCEKDTLQLYFLQQWWQSAVDYIKNVAQTMCIYIKTFSYQHLIVLDIRLSESWRSRNFYFRTSFGYRLYNYTMHAHQFISYVEVLVKQLILEFG